MPTTSAEEQKSTAGQQLYLNWFWRIVSGGLGIALIGVCIWLTLAPPVRNSIEKDSANMVIKSTQSTGESGTVAAASLFAGVALFILAVNGLRLSQFKAGGIESTFGKLDAPGEVAKLQLPATAKEKLAQEDDDPGKSPQPITPGTEIPGPEFAGLKAFALNDVPYNVIADAYKKWDETTLGPPPDTLRGFSFAVRAEGKGNHPWVLKFQDRNPIKVTYGGQQKSEATVSLFG